MKSGKVLPGNSPAGSVGEGAGCDALAHVKQWKVKFLFRCAADAQKLHVNTKLMLSTHVWQHTNI